ncbi:hypothetical protein BJX76DRAFT_262604 [Aspergillus varians]
MLLEDDRDTEVLLGDEGRSLEGEQGNKGRRGWVCVRKSAKSPCPRTRLGDQQREQMDLRAQSNSLFEEGSGYLFMISINSLIEVFSTSMVSAARCLARPILFLPPVAV